jgi:hypothetical protein
MPFILSKRMIQRHTSTTITTLWFSCFLLAVGYLTILPEARSESKKKLVSALVHLLRRKNHRYSNSINKTFIKYDCASNGKKIIFYFFKSIE